MTLIIARARRFASQFRWFLRGTVVPRYGLGTRIHPMARFEGDVAGIRIGQNVVIEEFAKFYCHKGSTIDVSDGSYIGEYAMLHTGKAGGSIRIGTDSGIQSFSIVYGHGGCTIGNNVRIAAHCVIIPANHVFESTDAPIRTQGLNRNGIKIGSDVWIGAGVTVLDGVTIGEQSVIGAGAVVSKSLEAGSVATGVPARTQYSRYAKKTRS